MNEELNIGHDDGEDIDNSNILQLKNQFGFPRGLALEIGATRMAYPLRLWVIDNSGSMPEKDGRQIIEGEENSHDDGSMALGMVDGKRWTELVRTVEVQAEMAGILGATTVFRFINDPDSTVGPQEFSVAESTGPSLQSDVSAAKEIIQRVVPRGATPLTQHIRNIHARIKSDEFIFRAFNQQVVIVLAMKSLPSTDKGETFQWVKSEFISLLKSLHWLPVWIVIRLCTDDPNVVDFFYNLESTWDLPLEVIDDLLGEAKRIYQMNKWLNYGLPLHRCREMGYHHPCIDLLSEQLLTKGELKEFLMLLLGASGFENTPDPYVDWSGFLRVVTDLVQTESKQWNPITRKLDYWIDLKQLDKTFGN